MGASGPMAHSSGILPSDDAAFLPLQPLDAERARKPFF